MHQIAFTGRDRKNLRNSEYSGFRLFGRIEWVPPLKTKKLLKVTVPNLKGDPKYSERGPKGDLILSKKGI